MQQSLPRLLILFTLVLINCQPKSSDNQTIETPEHAHVIDDHRAENALDWDGIYSGTLPCADCEGIAITLTLYKDMTYVKLSKYIGKDDLTFEEKGAFVWTKNGSTVVLKGAEDGSNQYFVGENQLFHLDEKGERITSALAESYILKKMPSPSNAPSILTNTYWKLIKLNGKRIERKNMEEREIHMIFDGVENTISGFAGCNNFGGHYNVQEEDKNKIIISEIFSTRMSCPDLEKEGELLKALDAAKWYEINKESLLLLDDDKVVLAQFEAIAK